MSKKKYTDEPLGKIRVVKDFLPPPKALALTKKTGQPKKSRARQVK